MLLPVREQRIANLKKNNGIWYVLLNFFLGVLIGLACVLLLPDSFWEEDGLLSTVYLLLMMVFATYFHAFVHEAGHGICGAICGYRFVSFRLGSLILMKTDHGLRFFRERGVHRIFGQCLMCPPEGRGLSYPMALYHWGGVLANAMISIPALAVCLWGTDLLMLKVFCMILFTFGIYFMMINGIPMLAGGMPNDGYNAVFLRKDSEMCRSIDLQLRVICKLTEGKRMRDLPLSWFDLPPREALSNPQVCALLVLRGDYFMDRGDFSAAHDIYAYAVTLNGILQMHACSAYGELLFLELLSGQYDPVRFEAYRPEMPFSVLLSSLRAISGQNPSAARILYTYEALFCRNPAKAYEYWLIFDEHCRHPQFKGVMEEEKELMALAQAASGCFGNGRNNG